MFFTETTRLANSELRICALRESAHEDDDNDAEPLGGAGCCFLRRRC
jgi:hypothetical protein